MRENPFMLLGFGPEGWGLPLLIAAGLTLAAAVCGFGVGSMLGILGATLKLSRVLPLRWIGNLYTTIFRGIPELLIVYLFYFGGSVAVSRLMNLGGFPGFFSVPSFLTGVLAIGCVSGAYQTEVFRAAFQRLDRGQIDAARSCGMSSRLLLRRIVAPQALRFALPALGNIWQSVLKETALLSVIGLIELLRQASTAAGSTRQPLVFYAAAAVLYLAMGRMTGFILRKLEVRLAHPWKR